MTPLPTEEMKPFPDADTWGAASANYVVSNWGRVYRVDPGTEKGEYSLVLRSFEWRPRDAPPEKQAPIVRINAGRQTRGMLVTMEKLFGNVPEPGHDPEKKYADCDRFIKAGNRWRLRINPEAPWDDRTQGPRCSIVDLQWVYAPSHARVAKRRRVTVGGKDAGPYVIPPHHIMNVYMSAAARAAYPPPLKWRTWHAVTLGDAFYKGRPWEQPCAGDSPWTAKADS